MCPLKLDIEPKMMDNSSGERSEKPINQYWLGSKFLEYCVKQGWLRQEGSGGRGTKWYPTDKGRKELKEKFGIELR
jgi:hypothetical protein